MTHAEMLDRMSNVELTWWKELYRVESEEREAEMNK